MQYLIRMFVAAFVFYVVVVLALPLFFAAIDFSVPAAVLSLLKLAAIVVAFWYVIWGPPVLIPGRSV